MKRILIIVAIILLPLVPVVLLVTGVIKQKPKTAAPVELLVWGTDDEASAFANLILKYTQTHPYVTINYKKVRPEDYQQQLVNGWAQNQGPDVFFVPHDWVSGMRQFATVMPASLSVPEVQSSKGFLGTSPQVVTRAQPAPSISEIQNAFVDAVFSDVVLDGQTWGFPLALDTIVTYYNKDLLNNAKIFEPARTWGELVNQVGSLTIVDQNGGLAQSAVALGTANNVPYATDLLTLLMMQNSATMVTAKGEIGFNAAPGLTALNFYSSFAQPKKTTYSWSVTQPNARDAFLQGKVAYFFGTLADRTAIDASNLNWGASSMLHLSTQGDNDAAGNVRFMDIAKYNVGMVSKASQLTKKSTAAWNWLAFMANSSNVSLYLNATDKLAANKTILGKQKDDPIKGLYAGQLLTARTWYHGNDGPAVTGYLEAMISSVVAGTADPQKALDLAADQVLSTL